MAETETAVAEDAPEVPTGPVKHEASKLYLQSLGRQIGAMPTPKEVEVDRAIDAMKMLPRQAPMRSDLALWNTFSPADRAAKVVSWTEDWSFSDALRRDIFSFVIWAECDHRCSDRRIADAALHALFLPRPVHLEKNLKERAAKKKG